MALKKKPLQKTYIPYQVRDILDSRSGKKTPLSKITVIAAIPNRSENAATTVSKTIWTA